MLLILILSVGVKPPQVSAALASYRPPQVSASLTSGCPCGDACPMGGGCGAACPCGSPSRPASARPEGDGWQWDAKAGHWWRVMPPTAAPTPAAALPAFRPAVMMPMAPAPSYAFGGGFSAAACRGGG